ncbi:hypothetical protein [Micromonospora sp. KC213]|uniref:hypothetical protein n=1 Tax=Micromonospora sp. KC213 TaxID=2530378 RepID=UPI0010477C06|nr:hypothetical protein [Micromonospora sp. KC213]TDC39312.1 hypothetical protein E1166_16810 [Micromonospora sp. KC213]
MHGEVGEATMTAPRTLIGSYLAMVAFRNVDEVERCRVELSRTGWVDADEVLSAAFRLAIRRCLGPKPGFLTIGKTAVLTSRIFPKGDIAAGDVEKIIRIGLGQDEEDLKKLRLKNPFLLRMLAFAALIWLHKVPDVETLTIVVQAEEDVFDVGYSPTLLPGEAGSG